MDSRSYDALVKLGYWFDDNQRLQLSVNRYKIKSKANYQVVAGDRALGIPSTSIKITPEGTPPWNDVWTSSLSYRHANLAGMELTAMVFNQEFEGLFGADISATFQDPLIAPTGTLYDQSRSVASKYGSKVGLGRDDLLNNRLKLTVGFDTLFDKGKQDLYLTGRTYVPNSKEGAEGISGETLAELVRKFNLSNSIMTRLTRVIDRAALTFLCHVSMVASATDSDNWGTLTSICAM